MYSYARKNPTTFKDPAGRHVCQGNKDPGAQIKAGYESAQRLQPARCRRRRRNSWSGRNALPRLMASCVR